MQFNKKKTYKISIQTASNEYYLINATINYLNMYHYSAKMGPATDQEALLPSSTVSEP